MFRKNRTGAFTLVELMAVIVIIGVLAAVVLQRFVAQAEAAKRTTTLAQIKIVKAALVSFKLNSGRYPTTAEGISALLTKPADYTGDWPKGGYLEAMPKDAWGREFVYKCPGSDGKDYDVVSYGADGKAGGEDENSDITN